MEDTITGRPWDAEFETTLRGFVPFLAPEDELETTTRLRDYGLDSISMITLLGALEDRYGIAFGEEALDVKNFENPGVLWETVRAAR